MAAAMSLQSVWAFAAANDDVQQQQQKTQTNNTRFTYYKGYGLPMEERSWRHTGFTSWLWLTMSFLHAHKIRLTTPFRNLQGKKVCLLSKILWQPFQTLIYRVTRRPRTLHTSHYNLNCSDMWSSCNCLLSSCDLEAEWRTVVGGPENGICSTIGESESCFIQ